MDGSLLKLVVTVGCEGLPYILFLVPLTVFLPALPGRRCCRLGTKKGLASEEQGSTNHPAYGATAQTTATTHVPVDMPPLAFTSQLLQCALWTMYGLGAGKVVCVIPNVGGTLLGLLYCGLYSRLADLHTYGAQFHAQMAATVACLSFSLVAYEALWLSATLMGSRRETMEDVLSGFVLGVSYVAAAVNTLLLGHPMAVLLQVWKTGRASLMGSASMNVVSLLCSLCWALNAALFLGPPERPNEVDWAIFVPNAIGVAVGGAAVATRFVLSFLAKPPAKPVTSSSGDDGDYDSSGEQQQQQQQQQHGGGALVLLEVGERRGGEGRGSGSGAGGGGGGGGGIDKSGGYPAATIRYKYHRIQDLQV